ncbi:CAP domain-containing protein [Streptomyces spiramyceticus]|uniref:CAP domain-containing protein n=1 Tax=Streptomyces spiramyceticus TaxID=299717 RepID=UPI00237A6DFA|nr:CAP domain-containing protein [Streptomyces spiramyceticus]
MNQERETSPYDPTPARHSRRSGAHRSRRPRRAGVAVGAVALITVVAGGYGAVQSLANSGARTSTAAEASPTPEELRSSGTPSATPSVKPSGTPSRKATTSASPSKAKRSATPKATPTAEKSRTQAPAAPKRAPAAGSGSAGKPSVTNAAPAGGKTAQLAAQVIEMVNTERDKHGCSPVTSNAKLQAAAQRHSDDMAARNFYDHTNPDGAGPGERITAAGYRWTTYGENIYKSPQDARTAMDGWMKSPGHRGNILNCAFKEIGVGINLSSNGPWWTQNFAASS